MKEAEISKTFFKVIPNSMSMVRCHVKREVEPEFSFAKFRVLANISRKINRIGDIADLHGVSQPAISKLVDLLVKDRLVLKNSCEIDKRVTELALTSKGEERLEHYRTQASIAFNPLLKLLNNKEKNELSKALETLDKFFIKVQESKS